MIRYYVNLPKLTLHPVSLEYHHYFKNVYQTKVNRFFYNQEFGNMLKSLGIYVSFIETFFSEPNLVQGIHTDDDGGDYVKLNWVYCRGKSKMNWYRIRDNINLNIEDIRRLTQAGTPYLIYKLDQVENVASDSLTFPSLVQVGCPHNVVNEDDYRLCLSVHLNNIYTKKRLTMQEAYERLKFLT